MRSEEDRIARQADEKTIVRILAALMVCPKSARVDSLAVAIRAAIDSGVV
jgi:hypothetical protein